MPFTLQISNDLTALMERLTVDMNIHGRDLRPMQPQFIVTQTEGMNIWVKQNLASGNGIVTNVKFFQPMDLVSRLQFYADQFGNIKEPLTRDQWCWLIYGALAETGFTNRFPLVRAYCKDDDLRRVALAWRLADLFDQYQIYRSDEIRKWNAWTASQLAETDQWQAVLWRRVKDLCGVGARDRVEAADFLVESLGQPEVADRIRDRFKHLYIFGLAVITPFFEQIFARLSSLVHIHLYQVNPSPREYWLDDTSEKRLARLLRRRGPDTVPKPKGNDLLINWGDVVKDSFQLLFKNDDLINTADDSGCRSICEIPGDPGTLLKKVQAAIYHNIPATDLKEGNAIPFQQVEIGDGSIVIKGCFTPAREVEVLYNYLLDLLSASKEGYAARDIVVIATDIGRYAPYIRATFDHGPVKIPYSVADVPLGSGDNMFTALAAVLDFDGEAFRAEDVFSLLEYTYVRNRLGIDDIGRLRSSVLESGVRYGLRRKPGQDEAAHPSSWFSWQHGMKRMIYGLAMMIPEDQLYNDGEDEVLPLSSAEGPSGIDRIKLAYFVRVLEEKVNQRQTDRNLTEWADYLKSAMEDLVFSAAEKEDEDYQRFIKILEDLTSWENPTGLKIPFRVFRHQFKDRLQAEQRSGQFVSRGITFCSPIPMRSIPHRVVAMLGMDFDAFPRDEQSVNFSLMAEYCRGDRNIRKNDNHLFLETLLSAGEKLYISYQARNVKDGTELPPSALVDELIDFVARTCGTDTDTLRKQWVEVHPLHPFSNRYDGSSMRNYLKPSRFATGILPAEQPSVATLLPNEISAGDIAKFLVNPARHFLNKRMQVYYREDEMVIPDHELFEIDTLRGGVVKGVLLRTDDQELEAWRKTQSRNSQIPVGNLGIASLQILKEKISQTRIAYEACISGLTVITENKLALRVGEVLVTAEVNGLFRDENAGNFLVRPATSSKLRNAMEAFVDYVVLTAAGHTATLRFIGTKGAVTAIPAGVIDADQAKGILSQWLDYFRLALTRFIPADPNLVDLILADDGTDEERLLKAIKQVEKKMDEYPFNDAYFMRAWQDGCHTEADPTEVKTCYEDVYGKIKLIFPEAFKKD